MYHLLILLIAQLTSLGSSNLQLFQCQLGEIPSSASCQIEVILKSIDVIYIKENLQSVFCYIQQGNGYHIEEYTDTAYDFFLKVKDVNIQFTEDPLEGIFYIMNNVKSLAITNGNMITIPSQIYNLIKLMDFSITSNNIESINLDKFVYLSELKLINASHNAISKVETNLDSSTVANVVVTIDLSFNVITVIPDNCFLHFTKLLFLDLSHNLITNFDILTFEGIAQLEILNVSYNLLTEMTQTLTRFKKLKNLEIDHNNLTNLYDNTFKGLSNLEQLNISSNRVEAIDSKSFCMLENIQQIDISYNHIKMITNKLFVNNTYLRKLILSNNKIEYVEDYSFKNNHLIEFNFNNNSLKGSINEKTWIGIFSTELNLSNGKIVNLEDRTFSRLGPTLQSLNLSKNCIVNISKTAFSSLRILTTLDLSHNNIKDIDFDKQDLKNLSELYVNNNNIEKVSRCTFCGLSSLLKIDLSNNKISVIHSQSFSDLTSLEILFLNNNTLQKFFPANLFGKVQKLQYLHITYTRFLTLYNESLSGMTSVKFINCSFGALSDIEYDTFKGSKSVELIDLSHNLLKSFNINTTHIKNIYELYLNNNNLTTITVNTFSNLHNLRKLNLAFNKIMSFHKDGLQPLTQLNLADFSHNTHLEIDSDLFSNLPLLSEVSLNNNIKSYNFRTTAKISIKTLYLSHCNISNLNIVHIYYIKNVLKIDLSSNRLSYLDKDSFRNMTVLNILDLSFNIIEFIQPGTFLHTKMIHFLNLQGNKLHNLEFGVLDGLNNLHILNLSSNSIDIFSADILHSVHSLTELLLDNNCITTINIRGFENINLKKISIGGNPIPCDTFVKLFDLNKIIVTAEVLDFHSENVKGIRCNNFKNHGKIIHLNDERNKTQNDLLALNKSLENVNNLLTIMFDKNAEYMSNLTNNLKEMFYKMQSVNRSQWEYVKVNVNDSVFSYLENISNVVTQLLETQKTLAESNNASKNGVHEDVIMKIKEILVELRSMNNGKGSFNQSIFNEIAKFELYNDKHKQNFDNDTKILLSFISICLGGFVFAKVSFFIYKEMIKPKKQKINNMMIPGDSSQALPNAIEMN